MSYKYGIKDYVCGVYMITNKTNGKRYIGASNNIARRISTHMNREARKRTTEFYEDADDLGYEQFTYEILEECAESELLGRETYYFEKLSPEYNMKHPRTREWLDPDGWKTEKAMKAISRRKELYNTEEYVELFTNIQSSKMRPCHMFSRDGEYIMTFMSLQEAGKWLSNNTDFKGKSKTSKVKEVCDGTRRTAYGYTFKYADKSVTTIPKGSTYVIDTHMEAVSRGG